MNELFVNIKVDREERPDLDEIYITATQLLNGSAGWPTSVFLTPDLAPFFAGTYFPPDDRPGRPGFPRLIDALSESWEKRRGEIETHAARVMLALSQVATAPGASDASLPDAAAVDRVAHLLASRFDETNGGFSRAPKFPSPGNLYFLWDRAENGDRAAEEMVVKTLLSMGRGAIYDQLEGGFHRYTLDAEWRIPHFEKMLYDNAFLGELLASVAATTGNTELERLARGTFDFVLRELTTPEGAFKSAIDAETDAVEGAYYVWTGDELREVLGGEAFERLAPLYGLDGDPNFEHESYTLYLTESISDHAKTLDVKADALLAQLDADLDRLRRRRRSREFPLVDDKVLTDWNGMMIAALAHGGQALGEERYVAAAERAAGFLLSHLRPKKGALLHVWRGGEAKIPAFLDDYAHLMRAFLALDAATEGGPWLAEAKGLARELEERLADPLGGYFFAPPDPLVVIRTKSYSDGAMPSGHAVAIWALFELAERSGEPTYRDRAERALRSATDSFERSGEAHPSLALAYRRFELLESTAVDRVQRAEGAAASSTGQSLSYRALDLVSGRASTNAPAASGWQSFHLVLEVEEGWHINAHPASGKYLRPTRVGGAVRSVHYPEGRNVQLPFADEPLSVYTGRTEISGELEVGSMTTLPVEYQICDEQHCLPPVTQEFPIVIETVRKSTVGSAKRSNADLEFEP